MTKLRVIQWATGNIGTKALRGVIEHPNMELAGLWVHSADKAGRDAGALCELPDTGVLATNDAAALIATDADCVLYMRQGTDIAELCALLASGKNVVTTRGDFHHPPSMGVGVRARIEAACAAGGSSIYSTGSSPGFITEALPIPLLSLQRRIECVTIDEYADLTSRNSPELLFDIMGFGIEPGEVDAGRIAHLKHEFGGSLAQIADAIGLPFDELAGFGEMSAVRDDTRIAAGLIAKGKVGAYRITIEGRRAGRAVMRQRLNWYCTTSIEAQGWDLRASGWRVQVAGDTPLDVAITFPVSPEDYPNMTPGLTAHRAVNAIPTVCAAPPGIRTTVELPQVIARFQ